MRRRWFATALGLALAGTLSVRPALPREPAIRAAGRIDFEHEIQPILSRCVQCHGAGQAKAGLRLDNRDAAITELASGRRAVVPGRPQLSEMFRRITAADAAERMPRKGPPLSAAQVEQVRRWIAEGATWPEHWAYRPLRRPIPPGLALSSGRDYTPIDAFVLAKLAEHGLGMAPPADRRTLLRRVYFDLIGLPPSPQETDAFLADRRPDAYERVVDRLLASPHYGERWARHWMDVAHYAETHGHDQDRPREHAWPYRDYLIRAFNRDTPYDRFVQEQVAGDVLFPDDPWATVATGFLATGPWDESSLRDIREDSIDREIGRYLDRDDIVTTVMSTFVSTTIHCARCHDHKFDPITQEEYYALQAVFAGTDKADRAYDADPRLAARRRDLAARLAHLGSLSTGATVSLPTPHPMLPIPASVSVPPSAELLDPSLQAEVAAWEKTLARSGHRWQVLELAQVRSERGATLTRMPDGSVRSGGKRPEKDTYTALADTDLHGITGVRLELLTDPELPHSGPGRQDNGNLHLNEFTLTVAPRARPADARQVVWKGARADFNQEGWTVDHAIDGKPGTAWGIYPEVGKPHRAVFTLRQPLSGEGRQRLTFRLQQTHGGGHLIGRFRLALTTDAQPADGETLPERIARVLSVGLEARTSAQRAEVALYYLTEKLERQRKALPPPEFVYCGTNRFTPDGTFAPAKTPRVVRVLRRGDIHRPGPVAEPGTLSCVRGLDAHFRLADLRNEGSRRAALARWLSDRHNGPAWRSIANRVWEYHFGRGLVDTPNDFGRMGSLPTHPELLDWLAITLQEGGGSLKKLHRLIVTSAVYRQSSRHVPAFAEIDADNHYLWRMNRQRLDAESIHDAVLCFSGMLDPRMGGPSVKQFIQTPGVHVTPNVDYLNLDADAPANRRRSVYRFVFRTLPDPFMEALDCPDASQLTPVRGTSVTALQALALLNDKFVVRQSEHIAARLGGQSVDERVKAAYWLILGRRPTATELRAVGHYAAKHGLANTCRVLLNSSEFVFVN